MLLSARQGLWYSVEWGSRQAGVVTTMIPWLVFYILLQRYDIGGLSAGAIKG
jgi:ABC-type glycerol-3-phosphate transport system permease component